MAIMMQVVKAVELVSAAEFNEEVTTVHICGLFEGLFHKNRNKKTLSLSFNYKLKSLKILKLYEIPKIV